jgi:hypothetical protein
MAAFLSFTAGALARGAVAGGLSIVNSHDPTLQRSKGRIRSRERGGRRTNELVWDDVHSLARLVSLGSLDRWELFQPNGNAFGPV